MILLWRGVSTEVTSQLESLYRCEKYESQGYKDEASNTTQWLWNGELTYSFLKGKRGLFKFQVVDILQQRDFVNRWMNDTGQGETWTWGLGRYAMATFTYRFNDLSR